RDAWRSALPPSEECCPRFGGDCVAVAGVATSPRRRVGLKHAKRGYALRSAGVQDRREPGARYAACRAGLARPTALALAAAGSPEIDRGTRRCGFQWRA